MTSLRTDQSSSQSTSSLLPSITHTFISLRIKLLVGFTFVFSLVFAGVVYWFYLFTTNEIINQLKIDMKDTLRGAAQGVDVPELLSLYDEGQPNAEGFSDDIRFNNQLNWLDAIHQTEPQAWLYLFMLCNSKNNRRIGPSRVSQGEDEIIYLVDLWAKYDKNKASYFLEADIPNPRAQKARQLKEIIVYPDIYKDKWGSWLSATAPLFDQDGRVVAMLGLDVEATYIAQLQKKIWHRVLVAFIIVYIILIALIYSLSGKLTRQLVILSKLAKSTSDGHYNNVPTRLEEKVIFPDELNYLSSKFKIMVDQIVIRERQIIENKKIEYDIRLALQNEKETNELKSRFISTISHEFRTPLTIIRTSAELLERHGNRASEEKRKSYFDRIKETVENMIFLLDNILEINREDLIKLKSNPEWFDVNKLCQDVVRETIDVYGKGHRIIFSPIENHRLVYLDRTLLRSMLSNILSNAVKYSPTHQSIEFELLDFNTHIQFRVTDHGIGIPVEDQDHLFEAFYRGHNATHIRGTGLGLQIVKYIVNLHHGQINIESQEGKGSTFTVQLPVEAPPAQQAINL